MNDRTPQINEKNLLAWNSTIPAIFSSQADHIQSDLLNFPNSKEAENKKHQILNKKSREN